jgi:hypothetical protein
MSFCNETQREHERLPMSDSSTSSSGRGPDGRFLPGHGGGRPFGARNRVSRKLLLELLHDFEMHKAELLDRLRHTYTPSYFNSIARMMPAMAQTEVSAFEDYSDAQAAHLFGRLRQVFADNAEPRAALAELDLVLASEPVAAAGHGQDERQD